MLIAPKSITLRRPGVADATITAQVDPEGRQDKSREMKRVFSRSEIRPADPDAPLRADQLLIGSKVYDVFAVEDFSDDPFLPHYEALVEQEGTDAVTVNTPTGAPTVNDITGAITIATDDDSATGWLRELSYEEVSSSGGVYQIADRMLRLKRDLLRSAPTTDTAVIDASGIRYRVLSISLHTLTQRWHIGLRKAP